MKLSDIHIRDPFILPYDGKYYLYGTRGDDSVNTCPGFDVYTSCDLENWTAGVPVFESRPDFWGKYQYWAPEVHYYNGRFYMLASFNSDTRCRGTHILVSDTPDGKFEPISKEPPTPKDWNVSTERSMSLRRENRI